MRRFVGDSPNFPLGDKLKPSFVQSLRSSGNRTLRSHRQERLHRYSRTVMATVKGNIGTRTEAPPPLTPAALQERLLTRHYHYAPHSPHQDLSGATPDQIYYGKTPVPEAEARHGCRGGCDNAVGQPESMKRTGRQALRNCVPRPLRSLKAVLRARGSVGILISNADVLGNRAPLLR